MNSLKKYCFLALILTLCLNLAACGGSDSRWRDTNVIDAYGTVVRGGVQTKVCVCHDQEAIYLYCDDEAHALFDTAALPTDALEGEDWSLGEVSFSDFTGDGNGDLQVFLSHADMSESYIVWTWEEDAGYVYQPYDSWFHANRALDGP